PQRAHHLAAHVVVPGQLVGEDHDVRQRRVAGAERLEVGHAAAFFLVVSAACFIARTCAPSLRWRMAWYGPAPIDSPCWSPSRTRESSRPGLPTLAGRAGATP